MDSGASDSCAPPSLAPEVEIRESVGSRTGQNYNAASGKSLSNLGKCLHRVTEEGKHIRGTWQIADISRPLSSVRQICKKGNRVIFGMHGGVTQNLETGDETHFGVEDNIYTTSLRIPPQAGMNKRSAQKNECSKYCKTHLHHLCRDASCGGDAEGG